ncbi:MAG: hypothetical protein MUP49_02490 [Dehalococcoidia bacterium]|nr:hypothetical protein [Dehalococcoidia bacterium]
MDNLNPWWSGIFALIGVVIGAILPSILNHWQRKRMWRREALQQQLNELYRPLYEKMVIMPETDPMHYFSDWEDEEFRKWLADALDMIIPKLHCPMKYSVTFTDGERLLSGDRKAVLVPNLM